MEKEDSLSIIHKKARVAREDFDARAMSPAKALRLAFAQAAEDCLDLALCVTTMEQTKVSSSLLTQGLADDALLILLDGAEGARGAAILDTQLVAGLIEMQVTGSVRAGEARARAFTRTDAAMMAPLLDAGLAGADARLEEAQEHYQPGYFRFGDMVEDARVLSLALQGKEFDLFNMSLDIGNGAKSGSLRIALPVRPVAPRQSANDTSAGASAQTASLRKLAMDAPVTLNAVLSRISRPLNEICTFEPGMILPVAPEAIGQAELVARPHFLVAEGRLGQLGGMRAIRVQMQTEDAEAPLAGAAPASVLAAPDPAQSSPPDVDQIPNLQASLPESALSGGDMDDGRLTGVPVPSDSAAVGVALSSDDDRPGSILQKEGEGEFPLTEPMSVLDLTKDF